MPKNGSTPSHKFRLGLLRLEERLDGVQEFVRLEWFGEEKFVGLEIDLAAHLVRIVAGGEDGFEAGLKPADQADQFAAGTVFEADIGDDEGDAVAGGFEKLEAGGVGGGFHHLVTCVDEKFAQKVAK